MLSTMKNIHAPVKKGNPTIHLSSVLQWKAQRTFNTLLKEVLRRHGLTPPSWKVLGLVHNASDVRSTDIAKALDVKLPLVSRILTQLEDEGLVKQKRHMKDRRVKLIGVTRKGTQKLEKIETDVREHYAGLLTGLSRKDIDSYVRVLETVVDNGVAMGKMPKVTAGKR